MLMAIGKGIELDVDVTRLIMKFTIMLCEPASVIC